MQILQKTAERLRIIKKNQYHLFFAITLGIVAVFFIYATLSTNGPFHERSGQMPATDGKDTLINKDSAISIVLPVLDTALYNKKLISMSNGDSSGRWPVKKDYPVAGALLPFNRIVAYYGNLYSKKMGMVFCEPFHMIFQRIQSSGCQKSGLPHSTAK